YGQVRSTENDVAVDYHVSDDRLAWIVTIRDDARLTDGGPLTAEDIDYTYETAKRSHSLMDLPSMDKVEKVDPRTVKFTLRKRNSTFIYHLTNIGIVPKHAYDDSYSEHPVGSGPFQMVQWNKGQQLIVKANPDYYGKKPYFKKLTFLFLSEDAAFAAARKGEVDVVSVPPSFAKE